MTKISKEQLKAIEKDAEHFGRSIVLRVKELGTEIRYLQDKQSEMGEVIEKLIQALEIAKDRVRFHEEKLIRLGEPVINRGQFNAVVDFAISDAKKVLEEKKVVGSE